jgi:hypothetical protein
MKVTTLGEYAVFLDPAKEAEQPTQQNDTPERAYGR